MISPIITYGLGSYGSVYYVPTYGFLGVDPRTKPVDVELTVQIITTLSFTSVIDRSLNYTLDLSNE